MRDTGKRGEQFSEEAPCIGSILQITLDDSATTSACPAISLVFGTIPQDDRCPIVGKS